MTARGRRLPAPRRAPHMLTPGQLCIGSDDPWQPTGCQCWPPDPRTGCQHCRVCDTCQDCRQCAGRGCACACEETCPACDTTADERCAACGSCRCDRHDTCTRLPA